MSKPKRWERIENIIHPERKKVLNELFFELTIENFITLIPNDDDLKAEYKKGYIKAMEKAREIVESKIYEDEIEKDINNETYCKSFRDRNSMLKEQ